MATPFNLLPVAMPKERTSNGQALRQNIRQFSGEAIVDEEIPPQHRGMVMYRGSWWFAQCDRAMTLVPGQRVEVLGARGTTLIVQPLTYW